MSRGASVAQAQADAAVAQFAQVNIQTEEHSIIFHGIDSYFSQTISILLSNALVFSKVSSLFPSLE